jgi:hypothetical protein
MIILRRFALVAWVTGFLMVSPSVRLVAAEGFNAQTSMIETGVPAFLSVSGEGAWGRRDIQWDLPGNPVDTLEAWQGRLRLGVDPGVKWITLYGALGAGDVKLPSAAVYEGIGFQWAAGAEWSLWTFDVEYFRFSVRLTGEFNQRQAGADRARTKWNEFFTSALLCFEIPPDDDITFDFSSLVLYVGPAFSMLRGESGNVDFSENTPFGGVVGADLYMFDNHFAMGAFVHYFDQITAGGAAKWHF